MTLPLTGGKRIVFGCDKIGLLAHSIVDFSSTIIDMADLMSLEASMIVIFSSVSTSTLIALAGDGSGGTTHIVFAFMSNASCFNAGAIVTIGDP